MYNLSRVFFWILLVCSVSMFFATIAKFNIDDGIHVSDIAGFFIVPSCLINILYVSPTLYLEARGLYRRLPKHHYRGTSITYDPEALAKIVLIGTILLVGSSLSFFLNIIQLYR